MDSITIYFDENNRMVESEDDATYAQKWTFEDGKQIEHEYIDL